MFDSQIDSIINFGIEIKGLDLLDNQPFIGFLLTTNQFSLNEIY